MQDIESIAIMFLPVEIRVVVFFAEGSDQEFCFFGIVVDDFVGGALVLGCGALAPNGAGFVVEVGADVAEGQRDADARVGFLFWRALGRETLVGVDAVEPFLV